MHTVIVGEQGEYGRCPARFLEGRLDPDLNDDTVTEIMMIGRGRYLWRRVH
ncbi:MAG: hypothetical protein U0K57_07855 [Lachnospiraceae bacterium]|nr:hypothetical protein [Lachnospiraceae bacterium]